MKREYYDIYEILYADYIYENVYRPRSFFSFSEYRIIRTIRLAIDSNEKEKKLRPDAKYFLLVNFHHLIVKPLIEADEFIVFRNKNLNDLEANIQSDISTIISGTKQPSSEREISGHQIMETIDRLWKDLKTTKLEIWG
jgi:hypothetical protein